MKVILSWLVLVGWLVCSPTVAAFAQDEPTPTPPIHLPRDGEAFKEALCRMAVGNILGHVQDHFRLYIELYRKPDATQKTGSSYGLLTGSYFGDRGVSGFGPTLDDPKEPRFVKTGEQMTNEDAAHLRQVTSDFRASRCVPPPVTTPSS